METRGVCIYTRGPGDVTVGVSFFFFCAYNRWGALVRQ